MMINKLSIKSIEQNFWLLSKIIFASFIILSMFFSWIIYSSNIERRKESLPIVAQRIDYVFVDSIQYIENYAVFIGKRISEHGSDNLHYIASLLGDEANAKPNPQNLFISTLFDWVNPQKKW